MVETAVASGLFWARVAFGGASESRSPPTIRLLTSDLHQLWLCWLSLSLPHYKKISVKEARGNSLENLQIADADQKNPPPQNLGARVDRSHLYQEPNTDDQAETWRTLVTSWFCRAKMIANLVLIRKGGCPVTVTTKEESSAPVGSSGNP